MDNFPISLLSVQLGLNLHLGEDQLIHVAEEMITSSHLSDEKYILLNQKANWSRYTSLKFDPPFCYHSTEKSRLQVKFSTHSSLQGPRLPFIYLGVQSNT